MNIPISPKHGLNPSMVLCFFCQEAKEIAIAGRLPDDAQAPREFIRDYEPCDKCKEVMDKGVTLVGAQQKPLASGQPAIGSDEKGNPLYPTGSWCVVTEKGIRSLFAESPHLEDIIKFKRALVEQDIIEKLNVNEHQ